MSAAHDLDLADAASAHRPNPPEKDNVNEKGSQVSDSDTSDVLVGPNGEHYPSPEDLKTLRRTHGHVPFLIYTVAFVELCERFAYYGTIVVCECLIDLGVSWC